MTTQTAFNVLGGPYNGYSPQQTIDNYKTSEQAIIRKVLQKSWNTAYATGTYNNRSRIITPFRAVNNSGDFLSRQNYSCGGSNQVTPDRYKRIGNIGSIWKNCDATGVPASICNPKFVADSSEYTKYRKQYTINRNYNEVSNGGDSSNASYVPLMAVHRR
jgi:hypothetical protein